MRQIFTQIFTLVFVLSSLGASAQKILTPIVNTPARCYTAERMAAFKNAHPQSESEAQFETWLQQKIEARKQVAQRPTNANYIVPVIFHIIHKGEAVGTAPNLNASMIRDQLLQLNKDFSNGSNSPYGSAANTGIQFVLAQKDQSGNILAEPGIERINSVTKSWTDYTTTGWNISYIDVTVKPNSIWNPTNYFNVWVIPNLTFGTTSNLLGYATFPTSSTLTGLNSNETAATAGVVVLTDIIGSAAAPNDCDNSYGLGKTLTHEAGHFFGLRHIWGDTDCGDDYCNDTPPHFAANYGIPIHPKSNTCGTPDEMFENYMDYTNDIVTNTFTTNQVDRMQTVMLNSPRRPSLVSSTAGGVAVTGSNKISFINCTEKISVWETGINNNYPRFKDLSFNLNVDDKATGSATVSISAAGTAIAGSQYQLLTPTVNFATGDNFKSVNIRIFDNAVVDGDRSIILTYAIAGTGVAAGANAQTLTITILDDDNMRVGENTINLLNESFENPTGTRGLPAGWGLLTTANYANSFVASTNGDAGGTGLCAHITNSVSLKPNTYTNGVAGAAILQSPVIDASSVLSLGNLSFTYKVRGLLDNDETLLTYTPSTSPLGPFYYYGATAGARGYGPYSNTRVPLPITVDIPSPAVLNNTKFNIDFYWRTTTLNTGANPGFNVDNIVLTATPFHIETSVGSSYTFDIPTGSVTNNFKSSNNRAIASIKNATQNISGVTAKVTQAGSGTIAIATATGSFLRTEKVFQISPIVGNNTVTYQATLYFTAAELAIWGADKLNLKIMKVNDGVSLSSTLNSSNAAIITPTVVEDAAAGYIAYTATFTGFSQFVLVSPITVLPVTFTSLQVTAAKKNIQLIWSTQQEINNRGFMVERSIDGTNFKEIGWINGNGTTAGSSTYNFTDNFVQRNITYYYRIRQVDVDSRQVYSPIKNARLKDGAGVSIMVNPNPAKDFVNLYISGTKNKASLELVNAVGQKIIQQKLINAFDGIYKLPLQQVAKGIYTLVVYLPEGAYVKKIVVQ